MKKYNFGFVQAHFDTLVDLYNQGGEMDIEEAREGLKSNLTEFLESGCNAQQITDMLSSEDVLENYAILAANGASINATELARNLGKSFIEEHLDWLVASNVDVDKLVEEMFSEDDFDYGDSWNCFSDDFSGLPLEMIEAGVKVERIFDFCQEWFIRREEDAHDLMKGFDFFIEHGLPLDRVKERVRELVSRCTMMLDSVVVDDFQAWEKYGVSYTEYAEEYIDYYDCEYLCYDKNPSEIIPRVISAEDFLKRFTVDEIQGNIDVLAENFPDVTALEKRILGSAGYSDEGKYIDILVMLVMLRWDSVKLINIKELARAIENSKKITECERDMFKESLEEHFNKPFSELLS